MCSSTSGGKNCVAASCHLVAALDDGGINYYIDRDELRGQPIEVLFTRIEESKIALTIFSKHYGESNWCLNELGKIMRKVEEGNLKVIPIFYDVTPEDVGYQLGEFGRHLSKGGRYNLPQMVQWRKDLSSVLEHMGMHLPEDSDENDCIDQIIMEVKKVLRTTPSVMLDFRQKASSVDPSENIDTRKYGIKQLLKVLGEKMDFKRIRSQLGMLIGCLLILYFCLQHIVYTGRPLLGDGGGAIDRIADIPLYIPAERTEITIDKDSDFPTRKYEAKAVKSSSSDAKANADLLESKIIPPQIQVFINFRGVQLRNSFVGYVVHALRKREVNVFIDNHERRGEDLNTLFKRIEDSGIAIAVFSSRYTESKWCLDELVKIKERVLQGLLKVIPIFYKVNPTDVKRLKGEFGDHFRDKEHRYGSDSPLIKAWKEAIVFVTHKHALVYDEKSGALESDLVERIVKDVLEMLQSISTVESSKSSN